MNVFVPWDLFVLWGAQHSRGKAEGSMKCTTGLRAWSGSVQSCSMKGAAYVINWLLVGVQLFESVHAFESVYMLMYVFECVYVGVDLQWPTTTLEAIRHLD